MKTLIDLTNINWFDEIMQKVRFVYTGHELDGFLRPGYSLTLEREGELVKYITGVRWKNPSLNESEKKTISNILIGYINDKNDIIGGRLYTELSITDKIYFCDDNS